MSTTREKPKDLASKVQSADFECSGKDTDGGRYESISEFWDGELRSHEPVNANGLHQTEGRPEEAGEIDMTWYKKSESYWSTQSASVEGMLGGLGELHNRDITASRRFITQLNDDI